MLTLIWRRTNIFLHYSASNSDNDRQFQNVDGVCYQRLLLGAPFFYTLWGQRVAFINFAVSVKHWRNRQKSKKGKHWHFAIIVCYYLEPIIFQTNPHLLRIVSFPYSFTPSSFWKHDKADTSPIYFVL